MHSGLLFVLVFDVADARSSGSASECGVLPFDPSPDVVDDVGKGRNGAGHPVVRCHENLPAFLRGFIILAENIRVINTPGGAGEVSP